MRLQLSGMATVLIWALLPSVGIPADELSRTDRLRQTMQTLSVAETALAEERFEVAEQFFSQALALLAEDSDAPLPAARAWNGRARIHEHRKRWKAAAVAYGKAAEFFSDAFPDPREPEALARYQCAHALWRDERGEAAETELSRATEIWNALGTASDRGPAAARSLLEKLQSGRSASAR